MRALPRRARRPRRARPCDGRGPAARGRARTCRRASSRRVSRARSTRRPPRRRRARGGSSSRCRRRRRVVGVSLLAPAVVGRLRPTPAATLAPIPRPTADAASAAATEEALARIERNLAREHAARYLADAGDVLVTVAASAADCDRAEDRLDVGEAPERSRELLEKRRLVESGRRRGGERAGRPRRRRARAARGVRAAVVRQAPGRRPAPPRGRGPTAADEDPPDDTGARRMTKRTAWALALAALLAPAAARAQVGPRALARAKALFFDRDYAKAREAWQAVRASGGTGRARPRATGSPAAARGSARADAPSPSTASSSPSRPADRTLAEEAKTSRVALAVKLAKAGETAARGDRPRGARRPEPHGALLRRAAARRRSAPRRADPRCRCCWRSSSASRTTTSSSGRSSRSCASTATRSPARPAPARPRGPARGARQARRQLGARADLREGRRERPKVAINLPVALAELVFKSLPEDAVADLRREGYDAASFWQQLKKIGPDRDPHRRGRRGRAHPGLDRVEGGTKMKTESPRGRSRGGARGDVRRPRGSR